jgi:hypothetical protein
MSSTQPVPPLPPDESDPAADGAASAESDYRASMGEPDPDSVDEQLPDSAQADYAASMGEQSDKHEN